MPQTIVAAATADRPDDVRDHLRTVASIAITENLPLEKIAKEMGVNTEELRRSVCDPEFPIPDDILSSLDKFVRRKQRQIEDEPFVETRISRIVEDVLDHAASEFLLGIIVGDYRTGKSYCARRWSRLNFSRSVYVEAPAGSDKNIFMRALGQAFGVGVSTAVKATQIEWKVRQACRDWKPVLILDEGHRLWNEDHRSIPQRIEFVRDLVSPEIGASVVIIATNQFANAQERAELNSQTWGSGQWVGRIGRYEELPTQLTDSELEKIISAQMSGLGEKAFTAVMSLAKTSDGYLGSIQNIAKMARHLARKDARKEPNSGDVLNAVRALIPTSRALRKQFVRKEQ